MDNITPSCIAIPLEAQVPAVVVLPVQTLPGGQRVPATGYLRQTYIDHAEMTKAGVRVIWQDADGCELPPETVHQLWDAERARLTQLAALDTALPSVSRIN